VSVESRVQTTDPDLNLRLAMAGVGLTILYDRRRHRSAALRALIDFVRREVRV